MGGREGGGEGVEEGGGEGRRGWEGRREWMMWKGDSAREHCLVSQCMVKSG